MNVQDEWLLMVLSGIGLGLTIWGMMYYDLV